MRMLSRHRRYLGALVAGIAGLLLLSNIIPDPLGRWQTRTVYNAAADLNTRFQQASRIAGEYLNDNFGFRASIPFALRNFREAVNSPDSNNVYVGRNGEFFWARQGTPEQSAGALLRVDDVERFVFMMGEMQRILGPRGTKVIVAMPPNAQSVELEELPEWMKDLDYPTTEYDLAMAGLHAMGVTTVDLRKVLREAPKPRFLQTDTHWNNRSSVIAFNATMVAAGHPDWQVNVDEAVGPAMSIPSGDLLRTMRMPPDIETTQYGVRVKMRSSAPRPDPALQHHNEHPAFRSIAYDYAKSGPRVLIMGDSFTAGLWAGLFVNSDVSVVGWMHASHEVNGSCDFNFTDVEKFAPDILIYARTERFFPCASDDWPVGLPKPSMRGWLKNVAP
ncbi:MAG: hypothetical protein AB7E29_09155 [Xanthobacter sp.]